MVLCQWESITGNLVLASALKMYIGHCKELAICIFNSVVNAKLLVFNHVFILTPAEKPHKLVNDFCRSSYWLF